MVKIVFALVFATYHGGVSTDLRFQTSQQCEVAKAQVESNFKGRLDGKPFCVELQVPARKLRCRVVNNFSYENPVKGSRNALNLNGYPYTEGYECVKE